MPRNVAVSTGEGGHGITKREPGSEKLREGCPVEWPSQQRCRDKRSEAR